MSHSYHQQCSELLAVKDTIITSLHDQIRTLNNQVESLKQGQDFRSYYAVEGTPHDMMQRRLRNILVEVQGWARMLFKSSKHGGNGNIGNKPVTNLLASGPLSVELQDVFKEICPDDTIPGALQEVKVQDAMAAVASNFVIREAVMNPLGGCTPEMKQMAESPTYKAMTRDNALTAHRRAAKIWEASCLKYYRSALQAPDLLGTPQEKSAAMEKHIEHVMSSVLTALKPLFELCQLAGQDQSCQRKLRTTIEVATKIGTELAELQSGLVMMDRKWFQNPDHGDEDGFISPSRLGSRVDVKPTTAMRSLFVGPHGQEAVEKGKLALVLFPGLLKYGSDDGDNWESWTVWIPAKVVLTDIVMAQGEKATQGSSHCQLPQSVEEEQGYDVITTRNVARLLPVNDSPLTGQSYHARSVPSRIPESVNDTEGSQGIFDLVVAHGCITQPPPGRDKLQFGSTSTGYPVASKAGGDIEDVDMGIAYGSYYPPGCLPNDAMQPPLSDPHLSTGGDGTAGVSIAFPTTTTQGFYGASATARFPCVSKNSTNSTAPIIGLGNPPVANIAPNPTVGARRSSSGSPSFSPETKRHRQDGIESHRYHPLDGMEGPDSGREEDLDN